MECRGWKVPRVCLPYSRAKFGPKAVQSKRNNESGITNSADVTALGQAAAAWRHYCVCKAGILHISCRTCGLGRATRIYLHARSQTRDSPPNLARSLVRARTSLFFSRSQKHFAPFRSFSDRAPIIGPRRKLLAPGVEKLTATSCYFALFAWKGQGLSSEGKIHNGRDDTCRRRIRRKFHCGVAGMLNSGVAVFVETSLWCRWVNKEVIPPVLAKKFKVLKAKRVSFLLFASFVKNVNFIKI